ncbi:hypothetical protein ACHAWO_009536 [Cyclotella atomus]|uniref:Helicase-associated domain-containing protein n=1 Tax=Cyclotella atomus TaxID=382360 RepID=A0ABD3PC80_9STRA
MVKDASTEASKPPTEHKETAAADTKKRGREEMDDGPLVKAPRVDTAAHPVDQEPCDDGYGVPAKDDQTEEKTVGESVTQEEKDDSSEDEAPAPPESLLKLQFAKPEMNDEDSAKFRQADNRRIKDDRAVRSAHSKLLKAKTEAAKAQAKYEECQRIYSEAKAKAELNVERDATALLLEPTPWNTYYRHLQSFYERNGHCNFKRNITDADVAGLSEEAEKELRTLSWWTCRQRKAKRQGELEGYKVHLLNRLNFEWSPHAGPGPEKWMKSFNLLKEYKQQNGHVKVPIKHIEQGFKLGSWLKTQITQYRNKQDGKQPALCDDRARMLEEIGVQWGQKRLTTPWDARYEDLLDFKRRFGHVNVPWQRAFSFSNQWKENISLAQWVNSQRKKYKDLSDGKRNNLSAEQVSRLNSIGFKWSTGGRGRYNQEEETNTPVNPTPPQDENATEPANDQVTAAPVPNPNYASGSSSSGHDAPFYPPPPQYFTRFPVVDPQLFNEHYANAQRFAQQAHQNNDPNLSYLQYAYHMNQLNHQFNNPANSQMREQMNQMFAGVVHGNGANGPGTFNGHSTGHSIGNSS